MRLLIAGGGTGGHLYPGVAVAEDLVHRQGGHEVLFAGTAHGLEARVLPRLGLRLACVRAAGLVGSSFAGKARALGLQALGLWDAVGLLRRFRPHACLGVGGYASFPVLAAAWLRGLPSAVQEQNARPGLTNRILGRVVARVYVGDEAAAAAFPPAKVLRTGNPLRKALAAAAAYAPAGPGEPARILVVGGSQGARALNQVFPPALSGLGALEHGVEVLHQAGKGKAQAVQAEYGARPGVKVVEFIDDMASAYAWAHLVVARAGALTLAELAAAGRPAILVPFPFAAGGHQEANARAAEARGAALTILERDLRAEGLAEAIRGLIADRQRLQAMAEAAALSARRDAAERIVDDLLQLEGRV